MSIQVINIRLLLLHAVATWFFIYSFGTLSFLYGAEMADVLRTSTHQEFADYINETVSPNLSNIVLVTEFAATAGLLIAFLISLFLSKRNYWHWANAVIILVVMYLLRRFGWDGWSLVGDIFRTPGKIFTSIFLEVLVNGLLMLAAGLLVFFLPAIIRFIQNGQRA